MKLNHVKVNYYKSFGETSNILQVEDDLTVIVGKNESGKSNLLELLSKIDLLNGISDDDLNKLNRKYSSEKPSTELTFKLDNHEINTIKNRLEVIIEHSIKNNLWEKACYILDFFSELYIYNKEFDEVFIGTIYINNKAIQKLSDLYQKFVVDLNGLIGHRDFSIQKYFNKEKNILSEEQSSGENIRKYSVFLENILTDLYSIFNLLNIDESLKIQFDRSYEYRIRDVVIKGGIPVNELENIRTKYNGKYQILKSSENGKDFFEILNGQSTERVRLLLVIDLFKFLEDFRLSIEETNKERIDNIISKIMNSINEELEYTKFILKEQKVVEIDGAFKIYFKYENKLKNSIDNLCYFNQKIVNSIENIKEIEIYNKYISSLKQLEFNIFSTYKEFCENKQRYTSALNQEEIKSYSDLILYIEEGIDFIYNLIPTFYLYEEKFLEDKYTYNDEFVQTFNSKNLIYLLFNTVGINNDDLRKIFNNQLSGEAQDIKNRINKSIKENIEQDFNNFYKQEKIQMSVEFDGRCFAPFIDSSNNIMNISERSRGLRWYLSMFIDMKANNLSDKKVIYLIDEPAVYLHPNAQKQVLEFLKSLTQNQNQLIYATHSPYMIDSNQLHKVRAFKKIDGITKIYNKVYNSELSKVSKSETLSPILDAIGLDLRYNLGPSNQMLNIVTEGITDYMYISAMANYLEIEGIYILPSVGAPNVDQLACILIGWGLNFKILLDYDKAGNEAAKKLKNLNLEINKDYYFLTGKDKFNREDETVVIEDLVNEKDISKMKIDENAEKIIKARMFKTKVENKKVDLSEETVRNFEQLFESLGVYEREKEPILT